MLPDFAAPALCIFDLFADTFLPIESIGTGTFCQSAASVPCVEPCACTFIVIFDMSLSDIPSALWAPPRTSGRSAFTDRVNRHGYLLAISLNRCLAAFEADDLLFSSKLPQGSRGKGGVQKSLFKNFREIVISY